MKRECEMKLAYPPELALKIPLKGCLIFDGSKDVLETVVFSFRCASLSKNMIHYLDLSNIKTACFRNYFHDFNQFSGLTKLYASNCDLKDINGLEELKSIRFLYLDGNFISELYPLSLLQDIVNLDISGNCGDTEEFRLQMKEFFPQLKWFNGLRYIPEL